MKLVTKTLSSVVALSLLVPVVGFAGPVAEKAERSAVESEAYKKEAKEIRDAFLGVGSVSRAQADAMSRELMTTKNKDMLDLLNFNRTEQKGKATGKVFKIEADGRLNIEDVVTLKKLLDKPAALQEVKRLVLELGTASGAEGETGLSRGFIRAVARLLAAAPGGTAIDVKGHQTNHLNYIKADKEAGAKSTEQFVRTRNHLEILLFKAGYLSRGVSEVQAEKMAILLMLKKRNPSAQMADAEKFYDKLKKERCV